MPDRAHRVRLLARVREAMRQNAEPRPAEAPAPRPARRSAEERRSAAAAEAELAQREAEARYHRDRLALYRARTLSGKPTSASRLRELARTSESADERLAAARRR
jgi:hypothetical protein